MAGTYETFYKLTMDPFRLSPDHRFSFGHPSYKKAKAYMQYALQRGEGFIMVTGSPGTGKTTLINDMLSQIDNRQITVVSLLSTRLKPDDMLHMVATSLGIACDEARKSTLLVKIKEALAHQHRARRRVVLMVDEAQDLSEGVLEELRLLSNMQTGNNLLLQVFLVGQEPLVRLVKRPDMEHLRQRIIAATHLDPLSIEETAAFIVYRLKRAGWKEDPVITSSALESIYANSGGIPRRINLVCSRLLFFGAVEEKHSLDRAEVDTVIQGMQEEMLFGESNGSPPPPAEDIPLAPDRSFAQRVRSASSVAYAVPHQALEEPDPAAPLTTFFDVVSEKPEDLVMEVVPSELETETRPGARIEPRIPDELPDQVPEQAPESTRDVATKRDAPAADALSDLPDAEDPEVTALQEPVWREEQPVPHSRDRDTTPVHRRKPKRRSERKGWGGFFLSLVFMVVVAAASFAFFRSQAIENLNLYERLTAWLEDQGVSFVLPLRDPNEPGTAARGSQGAEPISGTVNPGDSEAPDTAEAIDKLAWPAVPARADITQPDRAAQARSAADGGPVGDDAELSRTFTDEVVETTSVLEDEHTGKIERRPAQSQAEPIPGDPQQTDVGSGAAASRPGTGAGGRAPEVEELPKVPEETRMDTGRSIADKKDVAIASLTTRRVSKKPISELAVLKTGPDRMPDSLPASFTSNGKRDYSLVEIRSRLKSGQWGAFGQPAVLLPSTANHCKDDGVRIQCWSAPREQVPEGKGDAVVYQVESYMDGFSSSGTFEVRYRIMETAMHVSDQEAMDRGRMDVMPGWQAAEYETLCRIVHARLIRCYGGVEGVFSYTSLH